MLHKVLKKTLPEDASGGRCRSLVSLHRVNDGHLSCMSHISLTLFSLHDVWEFACRSHECTSFWQSIHFASHVHDLWIRDLMSRRRRRRSSSSFPRPRHRRRSPPHDLIRLSVRLSVLLYSRVSPHNSLSVTVMTYRSAGHTGAGSANRLHILSIVGGRSRPSVSMAM